jgi:hypothetical protein
MSTLTVAPRPLGRIGGEPTLDDVLAGVWEGLAADRAVECPVCRGEMEPAYGARARRVGGSCAACGATLR